MHLKKTNVLVLRFRLIEKALFCLFLQHFMFILVTEIDFLFVIDAKG